MRVWGRVFFLAILLFQFLAGAGFAYELVLKNGKVIKGHKLYENDTNIVMKDQTGFQISIRKETIDEEKTAIANAPPSEVNPAEPADKKPTRVFTNEDVTGKKPEKAKKNVEPESAEKAKAPEGPGTEIIIENPDDRMKIAGVMGAIFLLVLLGGKFILSDKAKYVGFAGGLLGALIFRSAFLRAVCWLITLGVLGFVIVMMYDDFLSAGVSENSLKLNYLWPRPAVTIPMESLDVVQAKKQQGEKSYSYQLAIKTTDGTWHHSANVSNGDKVLQLADQLSAADGKEVVFLLNDGGVENESDWRESSH